MAGAATDRRPACLWLDLSSRVGWRGARMPAVNRVTRPRTRLTASPVRFSNFVCRVGNLSLAPTLYGCRLISPTETLQQRLGRIGAGARGAGLSKEGFSSLSHGPSGLGKLLKKLGFAFVVLLLRTLSMLPYTFVARLGCALGGALYTLPSRRKHVVLVNLRLCFPEKTTREHDKLRENTFGM